VGLAVGEAVVGITKYWEKTASTTCLESHSLEQAARPTLYSSPTA
jgi:hypothetical protein